MIEENFKFDPNKNYFIKDLSHIKRRYCLVLLLTNKITKNMVDETINNKVCEYIKDLKGTIDSIEYCGEKELAYMIKGCKNGHAVAIYFYLSEKNLRANLIELLRKISLNNLIIRCKNFKVSSSSTAINNLKNFKK